MARTHSSEGGATGTAERGLIYSVCKAMQSNEKVVLTGEGGG